MYCNTSSSDKAASFSGEYLSMKSALHCSTAASFDGSSSPDSSICFVKIFAAR